MKRIFLLLILIPVFAFAESMYSPTWGFFIDPPEGYVYIEGDGRDRFSFGGPMELMFDLVVYDGRFNSIQDLVNDVNTRLSNSGDFDFFQYYGKQAAILRLTFGNYSGWAAAVELDPQSGSSRRPILLALAYGPASIGELELFHLSALDSICPTFADNYYPGIITEYSYPRGEPINTPLGTTGLSALIFENDAEAAQVLIEREFTILKAYINTQYLQAACIRYYRAVYRDSYDRVRNAVSVIAWHLGGGSVFSAEQERAFAQRALSYVQNFQYERDLTESDFINLVTAVTEGVGDCDSRAMLFVLILNQVDIRSAMMISHYHSHAMGLADISGYGARYDAFGIQWLVAETTDKIDIGLIDQELSDPQFWYAVRFE